MGASDFWTRVLGETAQEAFNKAVEQAQYDHGHSGYTGTIAEKDCFEDLTGKFTVEEVKARLVGELDEEDAARSVGRIDIAVATGDSNKIALATAEALFALGYGDDKWGPAMCLNMADVGDTKRWLFFGWASS